MMYNGVKNHMFHPLIALVRHVINIFACVLFSEWHLATFSQQSQFCNCNCVSLQDFPLPQDHSKVGSYFGRETKKRGCLKHTSVFSSPEPKAHGWAYSIPVTPASVRPWSVCPSTFSNISSETTGPFKLKFHMETPSDPGTKVCSNGPGHMTKMAATPIYEKKPLKMFFSRTRRRMTLGLGM